MSMCYDWPSVPSQSTDIDCQKVPRPACSCSLYWKLVEVIAWYFVNCVPSLPGCCFVIEVHQLSICISAENSAKPSGKIWKTDFQLIEAIDVFIYVGDGRLYPVPNSIRWCSLPQNKGCVFPKKNLYTSHWVGHSEFITFNSSVCCFDSITLIARTAALFLQIIISIWLRPYIVQIFFRRLHQVLSNPVACMLPFPTTFLAVSGKATPTRIRTVPPKMTRAQKT